MEHNFLLESLRKFEYNSDHFIALTDLVSMNKIGEPFYTTKENGTGIGLMVCFQIIESHEGTIQLDSKVGVGTTFKITFY